MAGSSPLFAQITTILFSIILVTSFQVVAIFWLLVFPFLPMVGNPAANVLLHGVNLVFMVIDTVISAQPLPLAHSVYFLLFGLVYLVFALSFAESGGTLPTDICTCEPGTAGCLDSGRCNFVYPFLVETEQNSVGVTLTGTTLGGLVVYLVAWFIVLVSRRGCPQADAPRPTLGEQISGEFRWASLSPDFKEAWVTLYAKSSVRLPGFVFIATRFVLALAWTAIVISDIAQFFRAGFWFVFITNISAAVEVIYLWMAAFTTLAASRRMAVDKTTATA